MAYRVSKIQEICENSKWYKVPSKLNPADIATRGLKASEFTNHPQWFKGPEFLKDKKENWPEQDIVLEKQYLKELRTSCRVTAVNEDWSVINPDHFSNWGRLFRTTGWIMRFLNNCRGKSGKRSGELEFDEIETAKNFWIKKAQNDEFKLEMAQLAKEGRVRSNSKIAALCLQLDELGILRVNSRIENAELVNFNTKYPIILPQGHRITQLIVNFVHDQGNHERGTNGTLADISSEFWIIAAREEIRSWEQQCNKCKL